MEQIKRIFDWIEMILKNNDYEIVDITENIRNCIRKLENGKEFKFELYKSVGEHIHYIFVLDIGDAEVQSLNIEMKQRELYKNLLALEDKLEPEFDKNVSLLLCVNASMKESLEKEVLKIEENPYCFKKFVLTYTQREMEFLENQTKIVKLWEYMKSLIDELREGKADFNDECVKFVMKLFIKLPFLPADIAKKQDKSNLMEEIEKGLEEKYKVIWRDIKDMDIKKIEEIKDYTEEQIDDILSKWCKEEA